MADKKGKKPEFIEESGFKAASYIAYQIKIDQERKKYWPNYRREDLDDAALMRERAEFEAQFVPLETEEETD